MLYILITSPSFKEARWENEALDRIDKADPATLLIREEWGYNTLLHGAVECNRLEIVRALIQKLPPFDLSTENLSGETPLSLALHPLKPKIAEALMDSIPLEDFRYNQDVLAKKPLTIAEKQFATALFSARISGRKKHRTFAMGLVQAETTPASHLHTFVRHRLFDRNVIGLVKGFLG